MFPITKHIDLSGNKFTLEAYANLIQGISSDKVAEEIRITTHKTPLMKEMVDFIKNAANYIFIEHSKKQQLSSNEVVAIYGEKNTEYCKKWLSGVGLSLSAGFIKETSKPETIKVVKSVQKSKNPYPKLMVYSGIFISAVKEAKGDILSEDLFNCIGAINSNNSMNAEQYEATILGKGNYVEIW